MKLRLPYSLPLILRSLAISAFVFIAFSAEAVTYYSRATGNWNNNNTWSLTSGGAAVGPGIFPVAGDIVFIEGGFIVTVNVPSACASVNIAAAPSQLTVNFSQSLTVSADFSGTGNLNGGGTARVINVGGNYTFNGTATGSFALTLNGSGNQVLSGVINGAAATNGQLIINKPSGTVTLASPITVFGSATSTFSLTNGTFDPGTFLLTASTPSFTAGTLRVGAANWGSNYSFASVAVPLAGTVEYYRAGAQTINNVNIGGNLTLSGSGTKTLQAGTTSIAGNLTISGAASTTAVTGLTIGGDVILNSGATLDGASFTHNVVGNWTDNGGTFTPSTSTINFNAGVAQQINGTDASQTFNNIIVNKGGGALTVGGGTTTLNLADLTVTAGSFTGPATLNASGDVLLSSGTFTAGTATNVGGDFTNNGGTFVPGAGTVTFNGAGAQSINGTATTQTFNNLTINKSGGTLSAGGSTVTLNTANLTQTAGNFTAPSTLAVSGTVTLTAGTFTAGTTVNLGGDLLNNGATIVPGTSTTTLNGAGVQNISGTSPVNLFNLTTAGSSTAAVGVNTNVGGNLVVGSGTSFTVAGAFVLTVSGNTTINSSSLNLLGTGAQTFVGLVTVGAGSTWLNFSAPVTFRGGITNNGTFTAGTSVHTFDTNTQSLTGTLSIPNVDVAGVTLINNNSLTVGTSLNGTGDFTQATGATLTLSGAVGINTLNAINSGNTVIYNGTGQSIFPTSYYNLTVNQAGGTATLGGTARVNNSLNLPAGNVDLGVNILTLAPGATIPGPVGIILASSGGELRKEFNATGSFTFPIGDNTGGVDSSPVAVNVTAGSFSSAYVSARVVDAKHPNNASAANFLTRYWIIGQSGITGATANITGTFVGADVTGASGSIAGAYLPGNFDQNSNPWIKGVVLAGVNMTLTAVPLGGGVNTYCTGITLANPTVSIVGGGGTVCAGSTLTTIATGDPTVVYSWSPIAGLSSSTIANPVANPAISTIYTLSVRDGNGIQVASSNSITVEPPVSLTITNPAAVCSPGTVDLTAPAVTAGSTPGLTLTYWTDAGATIAYATPATATAGTYYIKGTTAGGCTAIQPVTATVNPTPTVVVTNPAAVCAPGTVDLTSATVTAGSTASLVFTYWTDAGASVSYATPTMATAGTYFIKGTSAAGCFDIKPVVVTVDTAPAISAAGADQEQCNGSAFTLAGNNPATGTGLWTVVSGTATITTASAFNSGVTGVPLGSSATLRWTISNGVCTPSFDEVVLTNSAPPSVADAGINIDQCNNGTFSMAATAPGVGTGLWSVQAGTATISNPSSNTTTITGVPAGTSATLRWTVSSGSCAATFEDIVLTNYSAPTTSAAGADQNICGASAVLAANTAIIGTGAWSIVSGAGGSFVLASNPTTTFNGVAGTTYVLRWTISNGTCTASTDDVQIR
ncbi:MAG: hypothetical protein JNL40_00005, partial [Cyclobacteriaceae bacterium]|nr:hypothetical protein [Cyclobacteriaceae bacterium]